VGRRFFVSLRLKEISLDSPERGGDIFVSPEVEKYFGSLKWKEIF
jgi:hypothetical protein